MWWRREFTLIVVISVVLGSAGAQGAPTSPFKQPDPVQVGIDGPVDTDQFLGVSGESGPLLLPGPGWSGLQHVVLRETAGSVVTIRVTPLDELSNPVDGGTVVTLRPGERRLVRLADRLPVEDFAARTLRVETIAGTGHAAIRAPWLAPVEVASAAAAASHAPRRHLGESTGPSSWALIDQAESAGGIDHETAVLYRVWAAFDDARLPAVYKGNDRDRFETSDLPTVASEFATYTQATQLALQPFLIPPGYKGSWANPGVSPAASAGVHVEVAGDVDLFNPCRAALPDWSFKENPSGKVRVWYGEADDSAVAAYLTGFADATVWPAFERLLDHHTPPPDAGTPCSGGSDRLDIYLTDIPRAYTATLTQACTQGPAYIALNRADEPWVLVHEMFHAFQHAYKAQQCFGHKDYNWWVEGGATWAQDYVLPRDQNEQWTSWWFMRNPGLPLDYLDDQHVYGTYLLPFFLANRSRDTSFVNKTWLGCASASAIAAMDNVIDGGFAKQWPDFMAYTWNALPLDWYQRWDKLYYQPREVSDEVKQVTLNAANVKEYELPMTLAHMSGQYTHFKFTDANVRSVAFWNGATYDLEEQDQPFIGPIYTTKAAPPDKVKGVKIHAFVKLRNKATWDWIDWSNLPVQTYCRDYGDERIDELVIILSNSDYQDSTRFATPPGKAPRLFVSGMGCWQWKGTASWTSTGPTGTQTDVTQNVVWTRVAGQPGDPRVSYVPTGSVNVTMTGQCSANVTVPISGATDLLETYNYMPQDNTASTLGYKGQALEQVMIPVTCDGKPGFTFVGSWFMVPPPNPPQFPFFKATSQGSRLNDFYAPGAGNKWQWDFKAQSQP
jgi:hypothetical protein